MKQILLMIAVVALVGCGKKEDGNTGVVNPNKPSPKAASEKLITNPILEKGIRRQLEKPTGELTNADLEKVTGLNLREEQLTEVKGLEKLTQLKGLNLNNNQLTSVKGLEKLTQLTRLYLDQNQLTSVKGLEKLMQLKQLTLNNNPDLTKAQIDELQKALPNCKISSNPKK
jgi:Leucine-rich repeat (LRR) protein